MSSIVIFFTVTIAVLLPIREVDSKPPRSSDDIIVVYVNQPKNPGIQKGKHHLLDTKDIYDDPDPGTDSRSEPEEDGVIDFSSLGSLQQEDIINLIAKAKLYKNLNTGDDVTGKIRKESYGKRIDEIENRQPKDIETSVFEQLLSIGASKVKPKRNALGGRFNKRIEPNTLLPFKLNDDNSDNFSGLENYNKILIMMNPSAASTSSNKKSLNDLVSKMFSQYSASTNNDHQSKSKLPRYKGFLVDDNLLSRRARRESKEMYAPKDSMEDDYRPKRGRGERGGGGGGGRTSIPYIRHRGDIYERDN